MNERPLGSLAVADDVEMTNVMHQGAGLQGTTNDCPMEGAFSSSSSDLPSECGGCCGCSSEADDEQTDFPHSEPPPPKMAALLVDHPVINRPGPGGRAIGEHGRHHGVGQSGSVGSHHLGGLSIGLSHHHHHVASHLALTNEFRRRVHSAGEDFAKMSKSRMGNEIIRVHIAFVILYSENSSKNNDTVFR